MVSFLITAMEKWQHAPVDTFLWALEPASGTSDAELPVTSSDEEQSTPSQYWSQGHYTICAQKLKGNLENLPPADLLLLANCAFNSGDYLTAFAAGETLIRRKPSEYPAYTGKRRQAKSWRCAL